MIIATAGHVDHGKTQLVKAITGVDTDTLAEEKKRGLTIDIGFAYLPVEGQSAIGFIDVPGHERFIRNALCGLNAADFVLLIVAADDGLMPQTFEHLSIIDLLNIHQGAIVITKADRISADQIETVSLQISEAIRNTTLSHWPKFQVSSISNDGIGELKSFLVQRRLTNVHSAPDITSRTNFRLAVDRVFEKKGAGLIVTGTIFAGRVCLEDRVTIAGSKKQLRVRSLHIQNSKAEVGIQGQRCAINLAGSELQKDQINRGDWLVSEQVAPPVNRFDAEIRIVNSSSRPLAHWTPVHLHHGASESTGRVAVLENRTIKPGEKGLVQIVSDHPISVAFGDYFIIRNQSARITLGGGQIIDIFPPKRGRARPERIAWLKTLKQKDAQVALKALLSSCPAGVNLNQFTMNRNFSEQAASDIFKRQEMIEINDKKQRIGFSKEMIRRHCDSVLRALESCHRKPPEKNGFSETELLKQTKFEFPPGLLNTFLMRLLRESLINNHSGGYSLAGHKKQFDQEQSELWQAMKSAGGRGMTNNEIEEAVNLSGKQLNTFLSGLCREGRLVKLSTRLYIPPSCLTQLRKITEQQVAKDSSEIFTIAQFKNATGIGRNRCIELLECFDSKGITKRIGDGRKLLTTASDAFDKLLNKTN